MTINLELARHGVEVIYLGYHRSARDIARAAIQEDVRAIGLSSYNGGHVEFFSEVLALLRQVVVGQASRLSPGRLALGPLRLGNDRGRDARVTGGTPAPLLQPHGPIGLFGGGGGTITPADAKLMKRRGVDEIFFAGTPLEEMMKSVRSRYAVAQPSRLRASQRASGLLAVLKSLAATPSWKLGGTDASRRLALLRSDCQLAQLVSAIEVAPRRSLRPAPLALLPTARVTRHASPVIGFTGPGGAGKTTLIDELTLRFLKARPQGRLAILSHDPSLRGQGALLGDRASMIYAHDDRVFMRSIATGGHAGGLASATRDSLEVLRYAGFDLVLVESAGIGQEDVPFGPPLPLEGSGIKGEGLVDKQVLVMSPEYGGRLQLQKLLMLEAADIVAINKSDLPAARTAISEVEQRLGLNHKGQKLIATVAKRHRDAGVDELFASCVRSTAH